MALRLTKTLDTGLTAIDAYWSVARIAIDFDAKSVDALVQAHASKTLRTDGAAPLLSMGFTLTGAGYTKFLAAVRAGTDPRAVLYAYLKTRPEFSGAADEG